MKQLEPEMREVRNGRAIKICLCLWICCLGLAASASGQIFEDDFETGDLSLWTLTEPPAPVVFRFSDLDLRDPHVFINVIIAGCVDFTDQPQLGGLVPAFNATLEDSITVDGDGDGNLDLSVLQLFRPLDQDGGGRLDTRNGVCSDPLVSTSCHPDALGPPLIGSYTSQDSGVCLGPVAGTTGGYNPAVPEPVGPCFVSLSETLSLDLGGVPLSLEDGQIAASFIGDPAAALDTGLLRGFLSEEAAMTTLPPGIPQIGGQPISSLFPGGVGSCVPPPGDLDMHEGQSGWWIYLEFQADEAPYAGP